jgi:ribosome-associated protein
MDKLQTIIDALDGVNLFDISVFDMRQKSPFFDYIVIASASSERQLNASISHVQNALAEQGYQAANVEGKNSKAWILIDAKDIVINVFTKEERLFYNLEKMLADIDTIDLETLREL